MQSSPLKTAAPTGFVRRQAIHGPDSFADNRYQSPQEIDEQPRQNALREIMNRDSPGPDGR